MRLKERLLANALAAILQAKNSEVIVKDEGGNFLFHFDEATNTLRMDPLDPDEPLLRVCLGGTFVVDGSLPPSTKPN